METDQAYTLAETLQNNKALVWGGVGVLVLVIALTLILYSKKGKKGAGRKASGENDIYPLW